MTNVSPNAHHLTDTQLVLLSQASQRADGKVVPPDHLKGGVFRRVMTSLVGKGLVHPPASHADSATGEPDGDPAGACPVISPAGLAALGIADDANAGASGVNDATSVDANGDAGSPTGTVEHPATARTTADGCRLAAEPDAALAGLLATSEAARSGSQTNSDATRLPREGSKQAMVLELLARPDGASLHEVVTATGWLSHTARAVLSGLRKRGHGIERIGGGEDCGSRYRLASATTTADSLSTSAA